MRRNILEPDLVHDVVKRALRAQRGPGAGDPMRDLLVGRLILAPKLIDGQRWFEYRGEVPYRALLRELVSVNRMVPPG